MLHLTLYSTEGCHLCELAEKVLTEVRRVQPAAIWTVVDIADNETLLERYAIRIPVVQLDNAEYDLGWPFTRDDVLHYLRQFEAPEAP